VKKKTFAKKKKKREESAQLEFVKLKKSQEDEILKTRAQEKYKEWLIMKREKEKETVSKKTTEKQNNQKVLENKKNNSTKAYKEWKLSIKKREKLNRNSYGYSNGNLFCYYDMTSQTEPSYTNPVPWVDTLLNEDNIKPEQFSSPPLLWKDIEGREEDNRRNKNKQTTVKKHSCVHSRT